MSDPGQVVAEEVGGSRVVRVVLRVHDVRDLVAHPFGLGDLFHRPLEVVTDRRRCVEEDDACARRSELSQKIPRIQNPMSGVG
jgi:hypothetical protein